MRRPWSLNQLGYKAQCGSGGVFVPSASLSSLFCWKHLHGSYMKPIRFAQSLSADLHSPLFAIMWSITSWIVFGSMHVGLFKDDYLVSNMWEYSTIKISQSQDEFLRNQTIESFRTLARKRRVQTLSRMLPISPYLYREIHYISLSWQRHTHKSLWGA